MNVFSFKSESQDFFVRVIDLDGKLWFVGREVVESLDYRGRYGRNIEPANVVYKICKESAKYYPLESVKSGQSGNIIKFRIISEADMLRLIIARDAPIATKFERWMFDEVLPSMRKIGNDQANAQINRGRFGWFEKISQKYRRLSAAFSRAIEAAREELAQTNITVANGKERLVNQKESSETVKNRDPNEHGQSELFTDELFTESENKPVVYYSPTLLGQMTGSRRLSPNEVNHRLAKAGLQVRLEGRAVQWRPTPAGSAFSRAYNTGRYDDQGVNILRFKWSIDVLPYLTSSPA